MTRKDLTASVIIGALIGLLIQPILANNLSNFHLDIVERVGIFIFFALFAPFALWLCLMIGKFVKGFYQFGQFAAVGTLNSFIDIGIFNLETFLYGSSVIGVALFATFKAISFLCGTTNSFVWNKYWTFSAKEKPKAKEVTGFYAVAISGWVINVAVATLVKAGGSADSRVWVNLVSPLCGIAASFLWNFIGYKYFVFKKKAV
jgi:putative flippase GtrA